jgi:hypothetical protein
MVYCGATASLCALEALALSAMLPADMIVVQARIPNSLSIQAVEESDLSPNWSRPITSKKTQDLGTDWVKRELQQFCLCLRLLFQVSETTC